MTTTHPDFRVIQAPNHIPTRPLKTVFLSGSTSGTEPWQDNIISALSSLPITVFNPYRPDWGPHWKEDPSCEPWREQVEWELSALDTADVVAVYFDPMTKAPITLLELGLVAGGKERSGKKIVVCVLGEFWKKGNVKMVCQRYGSVLTEEWEDFVSNVRRALS